MILTVLIRIFKYGRCHSYAPLGVIRCRKWEGHDFYHRSGSLEWIDSGED